MEKKVVTMVGGEGSNDNVQKWVKICNRTPNHGHVGHMLGLQGNKLYCKLCRGYCTFSQQARLEEKVDSTPFFQHTRHVRSGVRYMEYSNEDSNMYQRLLALIKTSKAFRIQRHTQQWAILIESWYSFSPTDLLIHTKGITLFHTIGSDSLWLIALELWVPGLFQFLKFWSKMSRHS